MPPLKFGFHDFLNAQPLLAPLRAGAEAAGVRLLLDVPSALADRLARGELDLAMIPAVEYLRRAERYRLVPGMAIASRGPVGTVLLACRKPLETLRTLAVDRRSRTSVALLRVLFADRLRPDVRWVQAAPEPDSMLAAHDAALVIGDPAFALQERHDLEIFDLSDIWFRETGKPFVHAVVAVPREIDLPESVVDLLRRARNESGVQLEAIAEAHARITGLAETICRDYLIRKIIYNLGEAELAGLTLFRDRCVELGYLERKHPVVFLDC